MAPTFRIPANIVLKMEFDEVLPPGVHAPRAPRNNLEADVSISCSDDEARAMERWFRRRAATAGEPELYQKWAELIRQTLELPK